MRRTARTSLHYINFYILRKPIFLYQNKIKFYRIKITHYLNPICTGGGKFAPPLSYFNIAPKRKQSFALMHPDFESNLITHIFRKYGVSRTTGSDVIFAFVIGT